jgi:hypothetical protein
MNQGQSTNENGADWGAGDLQAAIERCEGGIVHFDATILRRRKMRQAAGQNGRSGSPAARPAGGSRPLGQESVHAHGNGSEINGKSSGATANVGPQGSRPAPAAETNNASPEGWWARVVRDADSANPAANSPVAKVPESATPAGVTASLQGDQPPSAAGPSRPAPAPADNANFTQNGDSAKQSGDSAKQSGDSAKQNGAARSIEQLRSFLVNFVVEQTGYP